MLAWAFLILGLKKPTRWHVRSANSSAFAPFVYLTTAMWVNCPSFAGPKGEPDNDEGNLNLEQPIEHIAIF